MSEEQSKKDAGEQQKAGKVPKAKPAGLVIPPKKPKLSKAERRALQEAQRAAKAAAKGGGKQQQQQQQQQQGKSQEGKQQQQQQKGKQQQASKKKQQQDNTDDPDSQKTDNKKQVQSLAHLQPYIDPTIRFKEFESVVLHPKYQEKLHPLVIELGWKYATKQIHYDNHRCRAMLECFMNVLNDGDFIFKRHQTTSEIDIRQYIDQQILKPSFHFWTYECRPHCSGMGNAFTFLKTAVASLPRDLLFEDSKQLGDELKHSIESYLQERLDFSGQVIAQYASKKIAQTGDVLLVYGYAEVIPVILKEAQENQGKQFRVVVVDSKPLLEGKEMLKRLMNSNMNCTYIHMNALSYVLSKEVTKVLLGATALMSDGSCYGRIGTANIALCAKIHNIPVLVCAETYKISHRVQLESFTYNELGNPKDVYDDEEYDQLEDLRLLNLLYDLTPSTFVTGIVTEMGILPPTSVAVLLREMNPQDTDSLYR